MKPRFILFIVLIILVISALIMVESGSAASRLLVEITPTPLAGNPQNTKIIFQDNFSDLHSGWDTEATEAGWAAYTNGEYVITSQRPYSYLMEQANQYFPEIVLDVDVTPHVSPTYNAYGVACHIQENQDAYWLRISGDGYGVIQKISNGIPEPLVDWFETPMVNQGNTTNHIQVVCAGSTLQLIVNGELVAEAEDIDYTSGDIGFIVESLDEAPNEIHFDNVVVTKPERSPLVSGTVLFTEDFSDPNSGWRIEADHDMNSNYVEGEYVMILAMEHTYLGEQAHRKFFDTMIDVDVTSVNVPNISHDAYGIACRIQPNRDAYWLRISSDGLAGIEKSVDGVFESLVDWIETPAVNQGSATNHLQAVCTGSTLQLYVNGELVVEAEDHDYTSGDFGFIIGTLDKVPSEIHFDNLVVTKP